MNKPLLFLIAVIMLATSAFASDGCVSNQNCTWFAYGATWATGADFTLTYPNGTTTTATPADSIGTGIFQAITNVSYVGNILGCFTAYNATYEQTVCESKEIYMGDYMILAITILLPMLLAFLLLFGAHSLQNEDHAAFKIAMWLISIVPFFISLHFAQLSIIQYYSFTAMQDAIGFTVYAIGIVYSVMVTYFCIYTVYKSIHIAAQKKAERLNY